MASYRKRLEQDLERWTQAGWVSPDGRSAILNSLPEERRLDAATTLGLVGAVLLGLAVIALIAANWDGMSRLTRFGLVLGAFAAAAGGAAFAASTQRPAWSEGLLTLAALIFAAAIGLTGQIFDIAGEPRNALYMASIVALGLGLAGRSIGAAIAAIAFAGLADFDIMFGFGGGDGQFAPLVALMAPVGAALAWRWKSPSLAHAGAAGIVLTLLWFTTRNGFSDARAVMLMASLVLALLAAGARLLRDSEGLHARTFYGWFAWSALVFFAFAGFGFEGSNQALSILHRIVWAGLAVGLIALGRYDRHGIITTAGVLGLIGAVFAILLDLGVDLISAGFIFLALAVVALIAGRALQQKPKPGGDAGGAP